MSTIVRRRRIFVDFVKNDEGTWLDNKEAISSAFLKEKKLKHVYCRANCLSN